MTKKTIVHPKPSEAIESYAAQLDLMIDAGLGLQAEIVRLMEPVWKKRYPKGPPKRHARRFEFPHQKIGAELDFFLFYPGNGYPKCYEYNGPKTPHIRVLDYHLRARGYEMMMYPLLTERNGNIYEYQAVYNFLKASGALLDFAGHYEAKIAGHVWEELS
jgi:hypothetical protein